MQYAIIPRTASSSLLGFFFLHFFFSHPFSRLLVVSLGGRIIWNPLGKALVSPSSFHSRIGLRKGCLGTCVYIFPWIGLAKPVDIFSFAVAALEHFTNAENTDEQTSPGTGQCWWWNTRFLPGGSILVRCSSVSTCSKDSPLILPARQTERDWWARWASGRQERNWRVSGAQREIDWGWREEGFQSAGKAICVVCPRDSSAATPHVCLRGKEGKPPLFFLLLWKTTLPTRLMLLPWCCAAPERGKRAKTGACCQHNWEKCNYFPSLNPAAFLLLSPGH